MPRGLHHQQVDKLRFRFGTGDQGLDGSDPIEEAGQVRCGGIREGFTQAPCVYAEKMVAATRRGGEDMESCSCICTGHHFTRYQVKYASVAFLESPLVREWV